MAGTRYQAGTATGKLPAVITAATPTGVRNVNSCLSGISLGTVCPYRRLPSERKKSQVSSTSLLSSTSRPTSWIARPRTGGGVAAHSGCAARAARQASTKAAGSPSSTSATRSARFAGLRDSIRRASVTLTGPRLLSQPLLERLELVAQPARQRVAERGEVLVHLRQLRLPLVGVHPQQLGQLLVGGGEPVRVEGTRGRKQPDRRLHRLRLSVAAAEDPLEHAAVLAEARPEEVARVVLAKPVHVEDPRQRVPAPLPDRQPVPEVVGHVIAAEGQHRHRIEAQLADGPRGRRGRLRGHDRAEEDAVLPAERLGHERYHRGAAPAEQEGVDRHPFGLLPLWGDRR